MRMLTGGCLASRSAACGRPAYDQVAQEGAQGGEASFTSSGSRRWPFGASGCEVHATCVRNPAGMTTLSPGRAKANAAVPLSPTPAAPGQV